MKRKMIALILIQLLILIGFCVWQQDQELHEYTINGTTLTSEVGIKTAHGYRVNEWDPGVLEGKEWDEGRQVFWFAKGIASFVARGSYDVTVHYRTDTDGNQIELQSWKDSPSLLMADPLLLSPQSDQMTTTIWLERGIENLEVRAFYKGEGILEIGSISFIETRDKMGQDLFRIFCLFLIIDCIILAKYYWKKHPSDTEEGRQRRWVVLILTGTMAVLCLPLANDCLVSGELQDLDYHLARIVGMKSALLDGQFPIRIHSALNWGFGYASPLFYPELFLYPSAILHAMGVPLMQSYKVFVFLMNGMTVLISYWCIKQMFKSRYIGLLGSMMYSLAYYRLINVYLRAAAGEAMALTFFPLIVYGLYRIYTMDTKDNAYRFVWIVPALGYSGLIQSHLISCEMVGIFTLFVCMVFLKLTLEKRRFLALCKTAGSAIILNLWFLVPMLQGLSSRGIPLYVMREDTQWIQPYGLELSEIFHFLFPSAANHHYLGLGVVFTIVFFGFLIAASIWNKGEKKTSHYRLAKCFFGFGALSLVLTLTSFPWDRIREIKKIGKLLTKFRLPSRYLSLATVFFTFLGCCLILLILKKRPKWKNPLFIAAASLIVLCSVQLTDVLPVVFPTIQTFSGANQITADWKNVGWGGEYLPEALDGLESIEPLRNWEEQTAVVSYEKSGTTISLQAKNISAEPASIQMPLLYYQGYCARTESDQKPAVYGGEQGILTVDIPGGYEGNIIIRYCGFWYWDAALMISMLGWIGMGILIYGIYIHRSGPHAADSSKTI